MKYLVGVIAVASILIGLALSRPNEHQTTRIVTRSVGVQKLYIQNLSPRFISDKEIVESVPAWEDAINKDFAGYWHTTQFKLIFIGRHKVPEGEMSARFVKWGPVKGALAYHTVERGQPTIVVYAGTGLYYGYSNSVSFTHELEELAADPTICVTNQGWPSDWVWFGDSRREPIPEGAVWAQEVSDPVESFSYTREGLNGRKVKISDFVTPNWFNDQVAGPFDFMYLVHQPLTILPGGYAQWFDGFQWNLVDDFRKGIASDEGFLKGESLEHS